MLLPGCTRSSIYRRFRTTIARDLKNINNNGEISLFVIGNGSDGNARSVFLRFSEQIFMFNCGEGVQRIISDLGFKPSKIETFLSTSPKWSNVSGLASLLLARYDSGSKHLNVHDPGGLIQPLIKNCITFDMKLKNFKFNYLKEDTMNNHNLLTIRSVPVIWQKSKIITNVYLGRLESKLGQINLEKCFRLKVPRNLVKELEENKEIINEIGQIVRPEDVCDAASPEQHFAIFECINDASYLDRMIESNEEIRNVFSKCVTMVHFTKDEYINQKEYKMFLERYRSAYHLLITESNPSFSRYSANRFQLQLNFLDPILFPSLPTDDQKRNENLLPPNVIRSPTGLQYIFRPVPENGESPVSYKNVLRPPTFEEALKHKDGTTREGIEEQAKKLHRSQSALILDSSRKFPEFVFLGTASSHSVPIRNVPAILVNLSPNRSLLMDCGENTYGQLRNFYGSDRMSEILRNIKTIFISHHHSDHHLGLVQLLEKRYRYGDGNHRYYDKPWIIVPPMVQKFLHSIDDIDKKFYNVAVNRYFDSFREKICHHLGVKSIELISVDHCAYAYGIIVIDQQGYKFVYSGDTQPCQRLIEHGKRCDLLIHEATVEDSLKHFARANFHTTMSEAIDVGRLMNAKFTILTHFSQRYGKLPFIPEKELLNKDKIGLAFDNLRITAGQLSRMPLMLDSLKCMYAKHLDNIKYRTDVYGRKYGHHQHQNSNTEQKL